MLGHLLVYENRMKSQLRQGDSFADLQKLRMSSTSAPQSVSISSIHFDLFRQVETLTAQLKLTASPSLATVKVSISEEPTKVENLVSRMQYL